MFELNSSSITASNQDSNSTETSLVGNMIAERETNERGSKRQRLSTTGDYIGQVQCDRRNDDDGEAKVSPVKSTVTATTQTPSNETIAAPPVDSEASADTSTVLNTVAIKMEEPLVPSSDVVLKEMCKIIDTDHYSREQAIDTLTSFCRWAYTDSTQFLSDFSEYGGIQRVLMFLRNNKDDPLCVMSCCKVIMALTHRSHDHENYRIASEITRYLTMRQGIQLLLDAGKEYNNGEGVADGGRTIKDRTLSLEALRWIWMCLMNITEKKMVLECIDKNQLLGIFETFLDTIAKLVGSVDNYYKDEEYGDSSSNVITKSVKSNPIIVHPYEYGSSVIKKAIITFCSPRKRTATEMMASGSNKAINQCDAAKAIGLKKEKEATSRAEITTLILDDIFITLLNITHNAVMTREDFLGMDLFPKCVMSIKAPGGKKFINNKELLIHASQFFFKCSEKEILSTYEDFEITFPLVVKCIRRYPDESFRGGLHDFVRKARVIAVDGDAGERSNFFQISGVIGAVAKSFESENVYNETKEASRKLLKELL